MFDKCHSDYTWPNRLLGSMTIALVVLYVSALCLYYSQEYSAVTEAAQIGHQYCSNIESSPDLVDSSSNNDHYCCLQLENIARGLVGRLTLDPPNIARFVYLYSENHGNYSLSSENSRDPPTPSVSTL